MSLALELRNFKAIGEENKRKGCNHETFLSFFNFVVVHAQNCLEDKVSKVKVSKLLSKFPLLFVPRPEKKEKPRHSLHFRLLVSL